MDGYYFRTSDLTVGYNGVPLIRDIEIRLRRGEILTLIGPNGSGKSTILKSITRHLAALRGDSYIADASVGAMSYRSLSRQMAVVLTDRIRGELLTCYDVVASGRYPYTDLLGVLRPQDRQKVLDAMEQVHAADLAERDFAAVSDGQRQRILLARALCQEPEILVLDEPTSFLDIRHKLELLSILRAMAKEKGITVILSLHEIDLAQKISDKVMCVRGETIEHFGTPEEIFREDVLAPLYGIAPASYNITFGSVELPPPPGTPDVFVISGGGTGAAAFRRLQREGRPFYTGILYTNDVDYAVARSLAGRVFSAPPFEPVGEDLYLPAEDAMRSCHTVLYTGTPIGTHNRHIARLLDRAASLGLLRT